MKYSPPLAMLLPMALALDVGNQFAAFKEKYGKKYSTNEESTRLAIFSENLKKVERLNQLEGGEYPPYGVTVDMDMSAAEFKARWLRTAIVDPNWRQNAANRTAAAPLRRKAGASAPSSAWSRFKTGNASTQFSTQSLCPGPCCSPIQSQGKCGDCWAFTATEVLETQTCLDAGAPYSVTRLSPQDLADCCPTPGAKGGCDGASYHFGWLCAEKGGVDTLADYPITSSQSGKVGTCHGTPATTGKVRTWADAGTGNEQMMLQNLDKPPGQPIGVAVDATTWQFYDGGRSLRALHGVGGCTPLTAASCPAKTLDHDVSIVGTYSNSGGDSSVEDAGVVDGWVIRNHWGPDRGCPINGEGGFWLLAAGTNTCGIADKPGIVFPLMQD